MADQEGDDPECESLEEIMRDAWRTAEYCAYGGIGPGGEFVRPRTFSDDAVANMVYAWAEGHRHKRYSDITAGHCSLATMINFDVGVFEANCIEEREQLRKILKRLGPTKRLTSADPQG